MAESKPRCGRGTGKPSPVDVHVGARVRHDGGAGQMAVVIGSVTPPAGILT